MPRKDVDLKKLGDALWSALTGGRQQDAKRHFDDLIDALDEATDDTNIDVVVQQKKDLRFAMVAEGETVLPRMTVCVIDNVAYPADGTDATRKATGVCVKSGYKQREIYWRPTGVKVVARVKRDTGVDTYGILYQSGTPGVLTNDPDEVGLAYVQQVAHFRNWEKRRDGLRPGIAEVDLLISGESGGNVEWGDIGGTLSDQTDLQAVLDTIPDLNDAFTPTLIAADESFTVPANKQVLFAVPIDVEGALIIEGALLEVVD